jgi:prevent-host-death family protein
MVDSNKSDAMTLIVNIQEAQTNLSMLIQRAIADEESIIAKSGEPVARLVPFTTTLARRVPGSAKGKIWIAPDFDVPLSAEMIDAFEGSESSPL